MHTNTIIGFNFTCFGFTAIFGLTSLFLYSILLAPFYMAITCSRLFGTVFTSFFISFVSSTHNVCNILAVSLQTNPNEIEY